MNLRKISMSMLILAGLALYSMQGMAAELKFVYVDEKAAIENSAEFKAGMDHISAVMKGKKKELDAITAKMKALKDEIDAQGMVMSPSALSDKQVQLSNLNKQAQRMREDAQSQMQQMFGRLRQSVALKFSGLVMAYGKEHHLDAIFPKRILFYSNSSLDITAEITQRMDHSQ